MIRWIRTHPWTSALPFAFFGFAGVLHVLAPHRSLLECIGWSAVTFGIAFWRAYPRRRR